MICIYHLMILPLQYKSVEYLPRSYKKKLTRYEKVSLNYKKLICCIYKRGITGSLPAKLDV